MAEHNSIGIGRSEVLAYMPQILDAADYQFNSIELVSFLSSSPTDDSAVL